MKQEYTVREIDKKLTYPFLLHIHYAKRLPPIQHSYGLYKEDHLSTLPILVGIITYGVPSQQGVRIGLLGRQHSDHILELNRLCLLENNRNEASILVGQSLNLLRQKFSQTNSPKAIISYADTEQEHKGIIYQATNFLYVGLSAKRTDWKVKGQEHLHGLTIADQFKFAPKEDKDGNKIRRVDHMRNTYGTDFYLKDRPRKHRYVYLIGSKKQKKEMLSNLKYKIEEYPK